MSLNRRTKLLIALFGISVVFALTTGFLKDQRQKKIISSTAVTSPTPTAAPTLVTKPSFFPVRVEPPHNQEGVSTSPQIVVYFNDMVGERKVDVKVGPSFQFNGSFDSRGLVLTINPSTALKPNTQYTVEVVVDGVGVYSWVFSTGGSSLTNNDVVALAKLKDSLPYKADHFWIDYKANSDTFYVYIDAKPVATYQSQALVYFKGKGISEVSKLKVAFVPVGEAANP